MIFDKADEKLIAQAADPGRRAVTIRWLSFSRAIFLVAAILQMICALGEFFGQKDPGKGSEAWISAVLSMALGLHADAKIVALKLFGKLSSNNSVQPTAARSAAIGSSA